MIATLTALTLPWLATACGPLADPELALPGTVRTASCASSPVNETGSAASADWPVYHHTPDRAGVDVSSPLFRRLAAGWSARLDGPIYASPLLARGLVTNFHGYVVGLPLAKLDGDMEVYTVPTVRQGGIWAPGGVVVMDGGDLLVPVGNTESTNQADYDGGNAVVRLSPDVRPLDFYAPHNWVRLTRTDFDLGSTTPVLVGNRHVFQVGKSGIGYLLNQDHLGGEGGELFAASLNGCYAIGGDAFRDPYVYVPCDHAMKAVRMHPGSFEMAWTAPDFRSGSPIVSGDVVWNVDFEGGHLWGFDQNTGATVAKARIGLAEHFVSLAAAGGRLFVPVHDRLLTYVTQ